MRFPLVKSITGRCLLILVFLANRVVFGVPDGPPRLHPIVVGFERFHNDSENDLADGGELLLGELGCVNCHQADPSAADRLTTRQAPRLEGIKHRVQVGYLERWVANPQAVKPGTVMPHVARDHRVATRRQDGEAIAQFLLSLAAPNQPPAVAPGDQERGRQLFHTVGCVACHAPESNFVPPRVVGKEMAEITAPSVPLGEPAQKFTFCGLVHFLADPLSMRPSARMPRLPLVGQEASDVAIYLLRDASDSVAEAAASMELQPDLVERGRRRFVELGCAACHRVEENGKPLESTLEAKPLSQLASAPAEGCLAQSPPAGVPDYGLNDEQRAALAAALRRLPRTATPSLSTQSPADRAQRWMMALNCFACHPRDGLGGPEPARKAFFETTGTDLEDEGRLPPTLSGVGRKLVPHALEAVLLGKNAVRPYMLTRMPNFGAVHAANFSRWFTAADLTEDIEPTPRDGRENLVGRNMWGRALMGITGLNCISCHDLRGHKSLGIGAMDLANAPKRLRPEWFRDYLRDPPRFRPGTRMPAFWPEGEPLVPGNGGTTARQIDSIWVYLNEIDQSRLPEGMEDKGNFELKPVERPIVFRTFIEGVGTHAIAAGFPKGLNAAFDAKTVCWSLFWKGRFLDAESTWDDRFTPLTKPLGEALLHLPASFAFHLAAAEAGVADPPLVATFGGYRLDKHGVPTFLYHFQGLAVEDRIAPDPAGRAFIQSLHLKGAGDVDEVLYRLPLVNEQKSSLDARVTVLEPVGAALEVCADEGGRTLRLPIRLNARKEATVVLQWMW